MYCVNCGLAVEGSIPICAHCASLVIAKEEEKSRFLEFIRQEAQLTTKKEDAPIVLAVKTEEPEPQSKEIVSEELQANDETVAEDAPKEENRTENRSDDGGDTVLGGIVFFLIMLVIIIILSHIV